MIMARPYQPADAARWDQLVDQSSHATFLHTRRFLDYHRDRLDDASLVLVDAKDRWVGVFPAALDPRDPTVVVSHPGCTYGGVVPSAAGSRADTVHAMIDAIVDHVLQHRSTIVYKAVPAHVVPVPLQSDIHRLWLRGAEMIRRDLWNAFPLDVPRKMSKGHKWSRGQARKAELEVRPLIEDADYAAFHHMLSANLAARHDTRPVHSVADLQDLRSRLGDTVALYGVRAPGGPWLATTWVFRFGTRAWHTQYIASSPDGRDVGATVFLLDGVIQAAAEAGVAWFSFGASTEEAGRSLNAGLYGHKAGFGAGAVVADTYRLGG